MEVIKKPMKGPVLTVSTGWRPGLLPAHPLHPISVFLSSIQFDRYSVEECTFKDSGD